MAAGLIFCHSDTSVALLLLVIAYAFGAVQPEPPLTASGPEDLLVVMAPTGLTRDGLPVYRTHPDASPYRVALGSGFSGRLLRLFRWEQQFLNLRDGRAVEPAYLLLSTNQGGFPRFGFWLDDQNKADVGYVDLHERMAPAGQYGALDQIFPHELLHVVMQQLAAPLPPGAGGANQVHAIGVRTDRRTAFHEGFAEHAQVLAIDDPDARPETAALASDEQSHRRALDHLQRYRRALEARWSLAPPARLAFVLWFSQSEQALRYHAVKANAFAREAAIAPRLLSSADLYPAYLLENTLPGAPDAPIKSTPRLLASEGVIAALFSRWVRDPVLQEPVRDPAFYRRFGASPDEVAPIEHAYLKLFAAMADGQPHDAASLVRAYLDAFAAERDAIAAQVRAAGLDWPLPDVPEVWLANDRLMTGTTLFDQYRALPRVHTFDLNAASAVDLRSVEGVTPGHAAAIARSGPYGSVADLSRVRGVPPALVDRFTAMHGAVTAVRESNAGSDIESIDLMQLFRPVLVRAALWILASAAAAGWLYRRVRHVAVWRAAANGMAASSIGLLLAWVLGAGLQVQGRLVEPAIFICVPLSVFGVPGALWQLTWHRSPRDAGTVVAAWACACAPALLVTLPLL